MDKNKKTLCCLAMLLNLTRQDGTVSGIPRLRLWSVKIVDYVRTLDADVTVIDEVNGKFGIIAVAEGLTDAFGRMAVIEGAEIPDAIFNGWVKAADNVLHPSE